MSKEERGMKKWAPFSSLTEQASFLQEMFKERNKTSEPILSDDQIEEIDFILHNYLDHKLKIHYYEYSMKVIEGYITKIDKYNDLIKIDNKFIHLSKIKKIQVR